MTFDDIWLVIENWSKIKALLAAGEKLYADGKITWNDLMAFKTEATALVNATHVAPPTASAPTSGAPAAPAPSMNVTADQQALIDKYEPWLAQAAQSLKKE